MGKEKDNKILDISRPYSLTEIVQLMEKGVFNFPQITLNGNVLTNIPNIENGLFGDASLVNTQSTKAETLIQNAIANAEIINDNKLLLKQDKEDFNLETNDKTIVGAINESKNRIDAIDEINITTSGKITAIENKNTSQDGLIEDNRLEILTNKSDIVNLASSTFDTYGILKNSVLNAELPEGVEFRPSPVWGGVIIDSNYVIFAPNTPNLFTFLKEGVIKFNIKGIVDNTGVAKIVSVRFYKNGVLSGTSTSSITSVGELVDLHFSQTVLANDSWYFTFEITDGAGTITTKGLLTYEIGFQGVNADINATISSVVIDDSDTLPTGGINPKLVQVDTNKADILERETIVNVDGKLGTKQDRFDFALDTSDNTIVGAINELKNKLDWVKLSNGIDGTLSEPIENFEEVQIHYDDQFAIVQIVLRIRTEDFKRAVNFSLGDSIFIVYDSTNVIFYNYPSVINTTYSAHYVYGIGRKV